MISSPAEPRKDRAAALSIASNLVLIALKLVAGAITGSVAIITEAIHSSIDLVASLIAFVSVRKADVPADEEHRYGHYKIENLAAAIEGMLILVGSGVIVVEAIRHLVRGSHVDKLGFGIAVVAFSGIVNLAVSAFLARRARQTESAALEGDAAHLRTDALTSFGVLAGLVLVQVTGAQWIDPAVALAVAAAIVVAGVRLITRSSRVLVDEALPEEERKAIAEEVVAFGPRGVAGFHKLRTRRGGAHRYVDLHVQFREGTTLEAAHETAHELQDAIASRLRNTDVLIHLEPEDRVRPGTEIPDRRSAQVDRRRGRDRRQHHGVPVVGGDEQQDDGDQAGEHGHQPRDP
jgi:cation diffusion facilitator family transporter